MELLNSIYKLSLSRVDWEAGVCWPSAPLRTPTLQCASCGYEVDSARWLASIRLRDDSHPWTGEMPKVVDSAADYVALHSEIARVFDLGGKRVLPGSWVGATQVGLGVVQGLGALNSAKLKQGIDVIKASATWVFSSRVVEILKLQGVTSSFGQISFLTEEGSVGGYFVEEMEPLQMLVESEREKYGVFTCSGCGIVRRTSNRGTFQKKQFSSEFFGGGPAIARGAEFPGIYMNQLAKDAISALNPTGCSFTPVGNY